MKFGKQFEAQQVPEWKDVYCDYRRLKRIINDIKKMSRSGVASSSGSPQFGRSISNFRRLVSSGLLSPRHPPGHHHHHLYHHHLHDSGPNSPRSPAHHHEEELILIEHTEDDDGVQVQTSFIVKNEHEEPERVFFRTLDSELGKVNKFYRKKETELLTQAGVLDGQMEALISAKETVEKAKTQQGSSHGRSLSNGGVVNLEPLNSIQTGILNRRRELEPVDEEASVKQVKIDIPAANPTEAFASLLTDLASKSLLNMNLRKVKKAEDMLQAAFVEFYQGLCLLRNYSSLNLIAFAKALKKYDKATSRHLTKKYLKVVEASYMGTSDKIQKLMDRVEALFTKHFTESHRQKAMEVLRPETMRERHRISFFIGVFLGVALALLVALILTIRMEEIYALNYNTTYMNAVFPIFSMLAAILLHLYLYGLNIYLWRKTWINHTFILDLKRGSELGFRDVLLLASGLSSMALIGMILHLQLTAGNKCCQTSEEIIPFLVLAGALVLLIMPFKIFYWSTRFFLLRALWHCLLTPFYKVVITDFLLADQLTSQVAAIRDLEFVLCYYGGGFFKTRDSKACLDNDTFITFGYIMAILPFWCRMMQCLRRWYDESDKMQVYNAVKYFAAILALASRIFYTTHRESVVWRSLTIVLSVFATLFATYWDIVLDWGLLTRHSENPWLRDKLAIRHKSAYYVAMVSNVFLRCAWTQSLINVEIKGINPKALSLMVACLEVIRRGQWNYYRLENEHFNNVGKYRAVKTVPLPFVD